MNRTANSIHIQQRFILTQLATNSWQSTFNLLNSDILFDEVEKRLPEHRKQLFPPTETLTMFITQALNTDLSYQYVVIPGCRATFSQYFLRIC